MGGVKYVGGVVWKESRLRLLPFLHSAKQAGNSTDPSFTLFLPFLSTATKAQILLSFYCKFWSPFFCHWLGLTGWLGLSVGSDTKINLAAMPSPLCAFLFSRCHLKELWIHCPYHTHTHMVWGVFREPIKLPICLGLWHWIGTTRVERTYEFQIGSKCSHLGT